MSNRRHLLLLLTLAVVLGRSAFVALSGHDLIDDSFISYRYAERLVLGSGLTFNPGERVEGYTNLLWVLLSAATIALGWSPAVAMPLAGVAAMLATAGLVFAFLGRLVRSGSLSEPAACLLLALLGLDRGFLRFSATGMETPLFALLIAAFGLLSGRGEDESKAARMSWMALPVLLCLTRPDGLLFVLAGALARWRSLWLREGSASRASLDVGRRLLPAVVLLSMFLAWKAFYYGGLLPNSYHAKMADHSHWSAGIAYLLGYLASHLHVGILLPFVAMGLAAPRTHEQPMAVFCGLALLLHGAFVAWVGGDFMEYRFMYHVYPVLIFLAALGVGRIEPQVRWGTRLALALAAAATAGPTVLEKTYTMQSVEEMASYARLGRLVGTTLAQVLPEDTVIATRMAGALPYYSRLITVDQWGLNDAVVAREGAPVPRFQRGHMRMATPTYLAARGVNLVFDHPVVCSCDSSCPRPDGVDVLIPLPNGACVRARYLTPTPPLTTLFCTRPGFVISPREPQCP